MIKRLILIILFLIISGQSYARVIIGDRAYEEDNVELKSIDVSPLAHYWKERKGQFKEYAGNLFVLHIDINGDGENDYLFSDSLKRSAVFGHRWTVYLHHKDQYWLLKGKYFRTLTFDYAWGYVGYIEEVEQYGVMFCVYKTSQLGSTIYTSHVELKEKDGQPIAKIVDHKAILKYQHKHWAGSKKDEDMYNMVKKYFYHRSSGMESLKIYAVDSKWSPPEVE